jgi:hypothetical protein
MTRFKKIIVLGAAVLAIGATTITAFAASNYKGPAEITAGLTGKSVEDVIEEKNETGKTYGTISNDAGKLQEFKDEMLANKKAILDQRVKDGTLSQEEADNIYESIKENQANCNGTGSGNGMGAGFGRMMGNGQGRCNGLGNGACFNSNLQTN